MAKKKIIQIDNNLVSGLTPFGGLKFSSHRLMLGDAFVKIYAFTKYPPALRRGWASGISNLPGVVMGQVFQPCDNPKLVESLSGSIRQYRQLAETTRDALEAQRAKKSAEDAESLMKKVDQQGEVVGYMTNLAMVVGYDEDELEKNCRRFEGAAASLNCRVRLTVNQMEAAFKTLSPNNLPQEEILKVAHRNVPISTFIEGFPFSSNSFVDKDGYPFARNADNGLVVLDPWVRGGGRTNSNFIVLGVAGTGKSATTKHLMILEYMLKTVCIVIDPEREYAELAQNLGGDLINAGGGKFIINPLQFKTPPEDDEAGSGIESLYSGIDKTSVMALHFNTLELFFKLYAPELTTTQISLLKQFLEMLYNNFGISWHTNAATLKAEDYPIFSDLYELVVNMKESGRLGSEHKKSISELEIILRELAAGSDSFLWNGHTTVNPKSNFICLDTFDMQETSDNVKKAQYYNLLTWCWERLSRDREERTMLFADEAYILVDPHVPQSLTYLRNISKRARKYEAGLCVITHSVVDFLDPSVKMFGQALLDLPAYKLIFGTDGVNLAELCKIYNLSEAEEEKCSAKKRGHALFFAGSMRYSVDFNKAISPYEFGLMGAGGGK